MAQWLGEYSTSAGILPEILPAKIPYCGFALRKGTCVGHFVLPDVAEPKITAMPSKLLNTAFYGMNQGVTKASCT